MLWLLIRMRNKTEHIFWNLSDKPLNPRNFYQLRNALIRYAIISIKLCGLPGSKLMKRVKSLHVKKFVR